MARAYLTSEQMTARVGGETNYLNLTNDGTPPFTAPDGDVEEQLLEQTDRIAEAYASRGGYTIPLSSADASFVMWALLDIANYRARSRGPRKASDDDLLRYQSAIAFFEAIAEGKVQLPSGGGADVATVGADMDYQYQQFTREKLRMW